MKSKEDSGIIIAKLEHGEDFFGSLGAAAEKHGITSGVIVSGIGMLKDTKIGHFIGSGGYSETFFEEPLELTTLSGNIAKSDGKTVFHVHTTLSDHDKRVHGGHLVSATVNIVNEIAILRTDSIRLSRKKSDKTGLLELKIG